MLIGVYKYEIWEKCFEKSGEFSMKVLLSTISSRRSGLSGPSAELLELYLERSSRFIPCAHRNFGSEKELLGYSDELSARTRPALLLTDSKGQQLTSREIASFLGSLQDNGIQQLIFAVGPADGWSAGALSRADKTIAFGRITLPHELAAVVAAEQLYRALTIRAGHPYHSGH
jgi:23S rRNA (pseudouridine1915-N3)-methyltransferase